MGLTRLQPFSDSSVLTHTTEVPVDLKPEGLRKASPKAIFAPPGDGPQNSRKRGAGASAQRDRVWTVLDRCLLQATMTRHPSRGPKATEPGTNKKYAMFRLIPSEVDAARQNTSRTLPPSQVSPHRQPCVSRPSTGSLAVSYILHPGACLLRCYKSPVGREPSVTSEQSVWADESKETVASG